MNLPTKTQYNSIGTVKAKKKTVAEIGNYASPTQRYSDVVHWPNCGVKDH